MKYLSCVVVSLLGYGFCTLVAGAITLHWEPASNAVLVVLLIDAAVDRLFARLK